MAARDQRALLRPLTRRGYGLLTAAAAVGEGRLATTGVTTGCGRANEFDNRVVGRASPPEPETQNCPSHRLPERPLHFQSYWA